MAPATHFSLSRMTFPQLNPGVRLQKIVSILGLANNTAEIRQSALKGLRTLERAKIRRELIKLGRPIPDELALGSRLKSRAAFVPPAPTAHNAKLAKREEKWTFVREQLQKMPAMIKSFREVILHILGYNYFFRKGHRKRKPRKQRIRFNKTQKKN